MPLNPPQAYRKTEFTHRSGTAANRPAAGDVLAGTLYFATDTGAISRSDGVATWTSFGSSGSPWVLQATSTPTGVSSVDFTGLVGYADIRVIVSGITFGVASRPTLRVSTDNGASYFSTGGDYVSISGAGGPTNASEIEFMDTNLTTSRNGEILLEGCNVLGAPKVSRANFFSSDNFNMRFAINATIIANDVDAVRVLATQNFTGGTIYVLGRR
jgi:hypothetical protein